jgi:hypothetical protein
MIQDIEVNSFDLRYESYRLRHEGAERALLCSISDYGIRDPLEGIDTKCGRILLNGFKRLRCAIKLGMGIVPYTSLGTDEVMGVINFLRIANAKGLSILEQARLIDDLRSVHKMSVVEIAQSLERSKSWVSMRLGVIGKMSEGVRQKIFKGEFPVYSYMYTLRQFIRMNCAGKDDIEKFVDSVAGKNLSIRDIERLAYGYFRGPGDFRDQIREGKIVWALDKMKEVSCEMEDCNESERGMLRDLEIIQKYMSKLIIYKGQDTKFKHNSFFVQANLLAGGILSKLTIFQKSMRQFYDRTGNP